MVATLRKWSSDCFLTNNGIIKLVDDESALRTCIRTYGRLDMGE